MHTSVCVCGLILSLLMLISRNRLAINQGHLLKWGLLGSEPVALLRNIIVYSRTSLCVFVCAFT